MNIVFADTFYWIALVNRNESAHQRATDFARTHTGQTLTTEWVLAEVADGLSHTNHRHLVQPLRQLWRSDQRLVIAEANHDSFERGLDLFCNRADKNWSLTNCISFVLMREHGVSEASTADHHFEQAGYTALLLK